jgi:hypothetical protein
MISDCAVPRLDRADFSIDKIRVHFEHGVTAPGSVHGSLLVSLEPALQRRSRGFGGSSHEIKKYRAALRIELDELKRMIDAITNDLMACRNVLMDHNLSNALPARRKRKRRGGE